MSTQKENLKLIRGKSSRIDEVVIQFHKLGYERVENIYDFGQFSVSGGCVKIFSIFDKNPTTIDFWGNEIDAIYSYNLTTKKKIKNVESLIIPNNLGDFDGEKIRPGELVVHDDHGIGIFRGKVIKSFKEEKKIFFKIEYLNNDCLFVPEKVKEKITKYQGINRKKPRLSRLGSAVWSKTKKRVEESIIQMAKDLLEVYAKRELVVKSKKVRIDQEWDKQLTDTFEHIETPDQETAIKQIYNDLEKEIPMDRLLVGDVGFGKTEVAIRAATQVINNGLQAIILAPTTILSRQHYKTIFKRLEQFPIKISELSRFLSSEKQKEVIDNFSTGKIDLLIGTHKILNAKINYQNLGLLIIDEEQKFGVKDKEKIKSLKNSIDILSMSATPIPRTLFISMSGIRDISAIKTPPKNRKPIITKVEKYSDSKVKSYIKNEINRGGQVYFLHNDVATIQGKAKKIKNLVPKAKVGIAHGQLSESNLASAMSDFATGDIDVLVCSTIIENGLDIPTVNTLIVEECDRFGLSQLYQIRGRIGRGINQAYAYLTYKNKLVGNAYKRLQVLAEKSELGNGFDIAFSDLEIRGGGNILGREQHGNMEELGLVLYTRLLKQAVDRIKNMNSV